jgi:hypothetical protein
MDSILHIIGLCPDHASHIDILDSLSMFSVSELYWNIQMIYLHLSIRLKNLMTWKM